MVCGVHREGIRLDEVLLYVYVINRSGSAEMESLEASCMFTKLEMLIMGGGRRGRGTEWQVNSLDSEWRFRAFVGQRTLRPSKKRSCFLESALFVCICDGRPGGSLLWC